MYTKEAVLTHRGKKLSEVDFFQTFMMYKSRAALLRIGADHSVYSHYAGGNSNNNFLVTGYWTYCLDELRIKDFYTTEKPDEKSNLFLGRLCDLKVLEVTNINDVPLVGRYKTYGKGALYDLTSVVAVRYEPKGIEGFIHRISKSEDKFIPLL